MSVNKIDKVMTYTNWRLWDKKPGMESENIEENPILPETTPDEIRQIHPPPISIQPPNIMQPPPPPPPPAEQKHHESPVDIPPPVPHIPLEHKTNLSQPPPNFYNYSQKWRHTSVAMAPMQSYIPHPESANLNMPPPKISNPMGMPPIPVALECCINNQDAKNCEAKDKELTKLKEEFLKEKMNYEDLKITYNTLLSIKNKLDSQSSSVKDSQINDNSIGSNQVQNSLNNSINQFGNNQVLHLASNIPQFVLSNSGQEQMSNLMSRMQQMQNPEVFQTQPVMSGNSVPTISISADQFQPSAIMSRPNRPIMHSHINNQMPIGLVSNNQNLIRSSNQPTSIMQPQIAQYVGDQTMGVNATHHYGNAQMVSGNYSQVNMQNMQQPFIPQNAGQIVNTSQAQISDSQQSQSHSRLIIDNIRQGLNFR